MRINKFAKLLVSVMLCLSMLLCGALVSCNNEPEATFDGNKVNVVRAKEGIKAGAKITSDKVEIVVMDASVVPSGALSTEGDVVGKFATAQIFAGDFFSAEKISAKKPADEGEVKESGLNCCRILLEFVETKSICIGASINTPFGVIDGQALW